MKKLLRLLIPIMLVLAMALAMAACSGKKEDPTQTTPQEQTQEQTSKEAEETSPEETTTEAETPEPDTPAAVIDKDGEYTSKEEVAEYIATYGELPKNYITKDEAEELGWNSRKGNLWDVAPGKSIGGDRFGNYEKLLPTAKGRKYYECDIDYDGGYRNEKRLIYSNDGLIYYTEDHYESFEEIIGED